MNFLEERQNICEMGRRIWQRGWTAYNSGNISVKVDENAYLVTPTGVSKGFMHPEMILLVNSEGEKLEQSSYSTTSEFKLHVMCYKKREDVGSVIHAHTPMCTVFAAAGENLEGDFLVDSGLLFGEIPCAPYYTLGTSELAMSIEEYIFNHDAMLLANHGVITVGRDVETAYFLLEEAENLANITWHLKAISAEPRRFTKDEYNALVDVRSNRCLSGKHPGKKG